MLKSNKTYSIPDMDLKRQLIDEIKDILIPNYKNYITR